MISQELIRVFVESLSCKDMGLLKSALEKREEAGRISQGNAGDFALAKANEAVLLGVHVGDGMRAYNAAKESLKDIEALKNASDEWQTTVMAFSPMRDMLGFIINWAESYEEAISYSKVTEKQYPNDPRVKMQTQSLMKTQSGGDPWWKTQFTIAHQFYSRSIQSEDAGKYASGMAVLHCILERANKETLGYDIDTNDIFDILDDFVVLSIHAYNEVLAKFVSALKGDPTLEQRFNDPAEQFIIYKNPLKIWLELMPECSSKWKPTFQSHCETLMKSPHPILPEIMGKLATFFPDAKVEFKKCEFCGHKNSTITPICVNCTRPFKGTRRNDFHHFHY